MKAFFVLLQITSTSSLRLLPNTKNAETAPKVEKAKLIQNFQIETARNIAIVDLKAVRDEMDKSSKLAQKLTSSEDRMKAGSCPVEAELLPHACAAMTQGNFMTEAPDNSVLIGVLTHHDSHGAIKEAQYYSQSLPKNFQLVYFTNAAFVSEIQPSNVVFDHTSEQKKDAVHREISSWRYLTSRCLPTNFRYKWFLQVDDDAIINFKRLGLYTQAYENKIGNPEQLSHIIGRDAKWVKDPNKVATFGENAPKELFGGLGLLATRKFMEDFGKAISKEAWAKAFCSALMEEEVWGDHLISNLITSTPLKDGMLSKRGPFGFEELQFDLWQNLDEQDQVNYLQQTCHTVQNCTEVYPSSKTCFIMHKAENLEEIQFAQGLMNVHHPTTADYEALWTEKQYEAFTASRS